MKAKFFKKLLCVAIAMAIILLGCNINASQIVYAESKIDYINYVSFGDSIATGYGLDGYSASQDFIAGSYETLFKDYLQSNVGDVKAESYAVDGHTTSNLLNLLQTNEAARTSVQNADVITVSVGGNDLLGPAKTELVGCFIQGSFDSLKNILNSVVSNFETNLISIISEFSSLNPNAKILFTNIYNPYKTLINAQNDIILHVTEVENFGETEVLIDKERIKEFGELTEAFIAGENNVVGLNQIIQQKVEGQSNFYYVDSKFAFDNYEGDYTDIARATFVNHDEITLTYNQLYSENKLFDYLDPHPTALGHQILTREFQTCFADNLALININYNGGILNGYIDNKFITEKHKKISQPAIPAMEHNALVGWSTSKTEFLEFDFDRDIVSNIFLYAYWQTITYKVTFDYNGGKLNNTTSMQIDVVEGLTVVEPSEDEIPVLYKFKFIGWYTEIECLNEFDFNTLIIEDITLYAKWEQVQFDVTFDYTGGELNGEKTNTFIVDKNDKLIKPSGENMPSLMDCALVGWFLDSEYTQEWNFDNDIVTDDITLYAKWERTVWYVTLNYNGGFANNASSQVIKVNKGDKLLKPVVQNLEKEGYVFLYWYLNDESVKFDFATFTLESNITLYAYWQEGIVIRIYYGDISDTKNVAKGTTVGELEIPKRTGTVFYGWFENSTLSPDAEYDNDKVLEYGQTLYVKWLTLTCIDETLLTQEFSPISKPVTWHIDARNQSRVSWQVNGEPVEGGTGNVLGDHGAYWDFVPANYGVGNYVITCLVDGSVVNGKTVQIQYSTPSDVLINLESVIDKKTYLVGVDNQQYYDSSKFVWYKTSDPFSDDFSEEIGRGFELEYTFDNDCKICVKYYENEDAEAIVSNVIEVSVDNHIDTVTLIAILISLFVVVIIVASAMISYRKNKGVN